MAIAKLYNEYRLYSNGNHGSVLEEDEDLRRLPTTEDERGEDEEQEEKSEFEEDFLLEEENDSEGARIREGMEMLNDDY